MKFKITGVEETKTGSIDDKGNVVGAKGGTEMIKEALIKRLDPDLASQFNIIHSRVREIDPNKKNILVLHDLFGDPEAQHLKDPESRRRFSKLVFVSNWQFQQYNLALGVPYRDSIVLKNAIEPINDVEKSTDGPIRLIYHTTPHRGLELLVPAYEVLYKKYGDKIVLDVYSSFNIYGWPQRDEQYKSVFDKCREHPGINYHGAVSNEEVREALKKAHIFAYPSIWQETSCIAAIEAMSAQCAVICPNLAALPETTANFGLMYQYDEDPNVHVRRFLNLLDSVIDDYWNERHLAKLEFQKLYVDNFYSWDGRINEWDTLLRSL
jgi:UDP-glucose:(glucosyl)LPS alpha-1,2-glucosyltransferase